MIGASEALQQAAMAAIGGVAELGVFTPAPVQAGFPHAVVDAGLEADWSHKSGKGREVRLAITLRDEGERPDRLQRLKREVEDGLDGVNAVQGWSLVSLLFLRSRTVREGRTGWAIVIEYRARMLATAGLQVPG